MCVLTGSLDTSKWKSGQHSKVIGSLPTECTRSYRSFWMAANVKVDGKQQWIQGGKPASTWQLTLVEGSKLALWTKHPPRGGVKITVSLSGVTLTSTSQKLALPSICHLGSQSRETLGEDGVTSIPSESREQIGEQLGDGLEAELQ